MKLIEANLLAFFNFENVSRIEYWRVECQGSKVFNIRFCIDEEVASGRLQCEKNDANSKIVRYIADTTLYWRYTQPLEIHLSTSSFLLLRYNLELFFGCRKSRQVRVRRPSFFLFLLFSVFPFFPLPLSLFLLSLPRRFAGERECLSDSVDLFLVVLTT